jgi:hypothetical protein
MEEIQCIELAARHSPHFGVGNASHKPRAQKNAAPLLVGPGLRGGRWPEAHVERDGERCYCGRGWVLRTKQHGDGGYFGRDRRRLLVFLVAVRDAGAGGSRADPNFASVNLGYFENPGRGRCGFPQN